MGKRILIVKLGAIGDALRTTPILEGLKRKFPSMYITWVTDDTSYPILENNPNIDRLLKLNFKTFISLSAEKFNLVANLDKDADALGFTAAMKSDVKLGYCMSDEGKLSIYNPESLYAYQIGLYDDMKFRKNHMSYQEIIFSMIALSFAGEEYSLYLNENELAFGEKYIKTRGLNKKKNIIIGFNTGCGDIFATKKWTIDGFVELAELLKERYNAEILLLGGPGEVERNKKIEQEISYRVHNTGNSNRLKEFASLINSCHIIVTADTTALHIAIALKVPVIALFGSTCHQEIFLYGRGEKIVSDFPCSPCYKSKCSIKPNCMESITASQLLYKIHRLLSSRLIDREYSRI